MLQVVERFDDLIPLSGERHLFSLCAEDEVDKFLLAGFLVHVVVCMLEDDESDCFFPVVLENLLAKLVCSYTV